MGWTPQQEQAITAPAGSGNIIVSAAAGSGKTAVLVERVLRKIIHGGEIDRLLIVTFTNAAAAEMREKIIRRLSKELDLAEPQSEQEQHLKRQLQLSESADIMTIDAFCIHTVQNNFHILGINPDISICDDVMSDMLSDTAIDNVINRLYKTTDPTEKERFSRLIEAYASNRDDNGLSLVVTMLYEFISSFAEPKKWLDEAADAYKLPMHETPYCRHLCSISRRAASACVESTEEFLNTLPDSFDELRDYAEELKAAAAVIAAAEDWDEIYALYEKYLKPTTKKIKHTLQSPPPSIDSKYSLRLEFIRSVLLDRLKSGAAEKREKLENSFARNPQLAEEAEDVVWLTKLFIDELDAVKDRRGVRGFSDIEHMTYELFKNHADIREAYKEKYDEILIDEYQDTNGLQDSIFELISKNNIFMVGDLKQSIYRFRGGDPYIFKEKSESYSKPDNSHTKITLAQNFRSRREVLGSVNDLFSCVMSNEAGDVEYRGDELIVRDAEREYYPKANTDCRAELHYIIAPTGDERRENELQFTIDKIKELLSSGAEVYDTELGRTRPIRKKDIVVLENSTKSNGAALVAALAENGIDAYCDTSSFFNRREIKVMVSLISVINNSLLDIPLITVMRSPIGGFSDNDLARIRLCAGRTDNFITAVQTYISQNGYRKSRRIIKGGANAKRPVRVSEHKPSMLVRRCRRFVKNLERWRGYVRHKSVAQLIWTIYEETYFYDIMGAIEQGEEAQFNLRLLYERAKVYEASGFKGLFGFIKYIGAIEESNTDLGGAKMIGENHDVVRIMTIHKSKGLEFPYVFLLGAGKLMKGEKKSLPLRMHKELKLGLRDINYDEHYSQETSLYNLIAKVNDRENKAEQMRLLYVALTRAREKLYIVAAADWHDAARPTEEILEKYKSRLKGDRMLPSQAIAASSFLDWLAPLIFNDCVSWTYTIHNGGSGSVPAAVEETEDYRDSAELRDVVYEILNYSYPYTESNTIPSRTSVTQLKELAIERGNIDEPIYEPDSRRSSGADDMAELVFSPLHQKPAFMREEGEKAANEIGTLYHNVMAELDLDAIRADGAECIDNELLRLTDNEVIAEEDLRYLDTDKIKTFYQSEIGQRLLKSDEIHRESPFQINISALEYDPSLDMKYDDETVILQGIIDCFFKEGDGYVLVDYKTDKVRHGSDEILNRYRKQLELYSRAIERLTDSKVREAYLYLFDTGETAKA